MNKLVNALKIQILASFKHFKGIAEIGRRASNSYLAHPDRHCILFRLFDAYVIANVSSRLHHSQCFLVSISRRLTQIIRQIRGFYNCIALRVLYEMHKHNKTHRSYSNNIVVISAK